MPAPRRKPGQPAHKQPAPARPGHRAPAPARPGHRAPAPAKPRHKPPAPAKPAHRPPQHKQQHPAAHTADSGAHWYGVGATYYTDTGPGACGNLMDGHFHFAELGTATRAGRSTGRGLLAEVLGLPGELPCGAGLWIRYRGRTTYATKADRGYGQGGDGITPDPHYAIDLHTEVARYLGFSGKDDVEIKPNFSVGSRPVITPPVARPIYVNPLEQAHVTAERIDQGVDYAGSGFLVAVADAEITAVIPGGWGKFGNYIEYKILQPGQYQGASVYYAEGVTPLVKDRQRVSAGERVAQLIAGWPYGIEIGFAAGDGHAHSYFAYHDGDYSAYDGQNAATRPGVAFSNLIKQLGGPPGRIEGPVVGKWPEFAPGGSVAGTVLPAPGPNNPVFLGLGPEGAAGFASQYDWGDSIKHKWKALHDGVLAGSHHSHAAWFYARGVHYLTKT